MELCHLSPSALALPPCAVSEVVEYAPGRPPVGRDGHIAGLRLLHWT